MKPATNLKVDIAHSGFVSPVEAVQGDGGLRSISVELTDSGKPWYPPVGIEVAVAYTHSNGTKGLYNKLPDGRKAITVRNNIVTAILAPQMLAAAGEVKAAIVFSNEKLDQLTTFPITITVRKHLFADAEETVDYIRLQWLEDKLDEYLKKAKDSGVFDGPKGDPFTFDDYTPEQLVALTGPQGPAGDNTAALEAALAANNAAKKATEAAESAQTVADTVRPDLAQLKNDLAKLEYLETTLISDNYADYKNMRIATLNGLHYIVFDVRNVSKIYYRYAIVSPDNRGLFFRDANGIGIKGVQTIAEAQNIDVPAYAVTCCATVNSIEDIICYDVYGSMAKLSDRMAECENKAADVALVVNGEQPVEILKANATYTDKVSGGITYTWNADKSQVCVVGTRTATSFNRMAGSNTKLPSGMEPGKTYTIQYKTPNPNIVFSALLYVNGVNTKATYFAESQNYTVPQDATGLEMRLQVINSEAVANDIVDCPEIYTIPDNAGLTKRVELLETSVFPDSDNPLSVIRKDAGLLACFSAVGCIGDSLSSGECAYKKEDGSIGYQDLYNHSWGQCLARMTGNTYYNFSNGGLTTKSWLASQHAVNCFDGNHDCTAYFIGLGQNDKNTSMAVGTVADIDLSNYENNEDTFSGNYGKIIQKLKAHQPKAPIFCFVDPAPPSNVQTYNDAVRAIAALFDHVYLIDLDKYAKHLFTNDDSLIKSQLRGGHYSAIAYQEMAYIIATYVNWIIRKNPIDFSQIEFVGTEWHWD